MVDQPNHKSYKIRGHSRQRRSSKPYSRPSEPKNKGLLDKVKDYLSPSWLFGYFAQNEDDFEASNFEDDVSDQNAVVTHEEGGTSSSYVPNQGRLASFGDENDDETFASLELNNDGISADTSDKAQVFDENNGMQDTVEIADSSIRLSGCLNDDIEDENERQVVEQTDRPHQSVSSYSSDQLTRKPLPSLLHSRSSSSSLLLQRGTPSLRSQGNPLLGSMSARSNLYTPSIKLSTPITSNRASFSSTQKPSCSLTRPLSTRNSSLKDNNLTQGETSTVDAMPRFNTSATSLAGTAQPIPGGSSAPLFSVEKFVTPVQRTFTNKRVGSPSYPGPVMFGGALNVSRDVPSKRRRMSSPGSESHHPVSKLRLRGVREKTIQHSTLGGTGTRTAQRILDALESVSSPLKDVRRIPSPISLSSASPLSFMASKTRTTPPKTRVGPRVSYLQARLLGDPPVSSLQTPEVAKVSFVEDPTSREPQPSPQPTSQPSKSSKHPVKDQSFFSGLKDTVLKSSLPSSFAPKSLPTSLSPIENTSRTSGKMRAASRSTATHYSSNKNNPDDEVVNPLPEIRNAVPLPLNRGKNMSLPLFNANKIADDRPNISQRNFNKQKESPTKEILLTESPKNGFIFSSPAPKSQRFSVKESLEIADDEVSFSFSEPALVRKHSDSTKETFKNPLLQSQKTSNSFKPPVNHSPNQNMKSNSPFSKSPLTNDITFASGKSKAQPAEALGKPEPAQTNDFAQRFAPAAGSWECTSCMINNEASAVKCVACETAKPSAGKTRNTGKDKQEINLIAKFAAPKDSWECETCLVRNKSESNKCAACETKRPGASSDDDLKLKFAAPSGSWECPTCMLQNKAADLKCVACETSKPGSSSNDDLRLKFAAPSGSWECQTCMVQNKPGDLKCAACQTGKPGADSAGSTQSGFALNQTSVTTSGFTFGGNDASKTTTSSGFTFGNSNNADKTADPAKTSAFTFGQSSTKSSTANFSFGNNTATTTEASSTSATTSSEAKPASGFTFGGNSSAKPTTTPSFTFGATSNKEQNKPPFSFGAENTSSQNGGVQKEERRKKEDNEKVNEKPSTTPTMSIAEAAAAGLLKVHDKDGTKTQPPAQTATTEPATAPTFTFGGAAAPSGGPAEQRANTKTSGLGFTPLASSQVKPFAFQTSTATTTSTKTTTGGLFTFGAQQPTVSAVTSSTANPTSLFSFTGTTPAVPSTTTTTSAGVNNTPFSFTPSNTATSLPNATTTVPGLATTSSVPPFNFAGSTGGTLPSAKATLASTQSNPAAMFSFIGSAAPDQAKSAPVFNFGAANGPTSSNGPSVSTGQPATGLFSFTGTQQPSTTPVVENQNSMGGEEMDADSNNNHDQTAFPQATGGFNFTAPTAGNMSGLFPAGGTGATTGATPGGFNFSANTGVTSTFQFGGNSSTPSGGFNFGAAVQTAGSSPFMFGGASTPASGNTNATAASFNFGGTSAAPKPQLNVGQTTDQPALFNMGAAQSTPRVYRKAVRRTRR